ncbi:hypothetical protein CEB3_c37790 [Peptococcaceae bacterium CEB3]|nr:hypothetical protein CEB3_c37790 [Peptococcaceae bacterium CEB3]
MLGATHALVGSAIYQTADKRWLSYALAFGAHYLLDIIPHQELSATANCLLFVGTGVGLGYVAWKERDWGMLIAGFLGVLPDVSRQLDLLPFITHSHAVVHTKDTSPEYGMLLELLIDISAVVLILRGRARFEYE